ncbi:UHRF1BP1L isoform 3 [Pan troglodytes]|uniref:Bridge-like lipid transfer protein family member 3B n=3 Tax=Hominidae TaxID=9604 RepID=F8VRN3_HUMAN|nr:UHRF1BP1L isoform 3 [Pan troglodytes]PNJ83273.1 UHRF1BP1L isoform 3 [Pongo abelii]
MAGIIKKQILKHLSSVPCWLWWRLVCCELHNHPNEYQRSLRNPGN